MEFIRKLYKIITTIVLGISAVCYAFVFVGTGGRVLSMAANQHDFAGKFTAGYYFVIVVLAALSLSVALSIRKHVGKLRQSEQVTPFVLKTIFSCAMLSITMIFGSELFELYSAKTSDDISRALSACTAVFFISSIVYLIIEQSVKPQETPDESGYIQKNGDYYDGADSRYDSPEIK